MAFVFKAKIDNVAAVMRKLEGLRKGVQNRIVRPAITKASRVVRAEAKRRAPKDTGALRRSLAAVVRVGRRTGNVYAVIGPETGVKRNKKTGETSATGFGKWLAKKGLSDSVSPAHTAHFSELGTAHEPPRPWLRPALAATRQEVGAIIRNEIRAGLAKYHERQRQRAK